MNLDFSCFLHSLLRRSLKYLHLYREDAAGIPISASKLGNFSLWSSKTIYQFWVLGTTLYYSKKCLLKFCVLAKFAEKY